MAGSIEFGDESEAAQTEALAGRMLNDIATQHTLVGERVVKVSYTAPSWDADVMVVDDLNIEFASGLRISCPSAHIDISKAGGSFRAALLGENERQRRSAPQGGGIRSAGERLADHPGPKLTPEGDPEQYEQNASYPHNPPQIEGTDVTYES